MGKKYFIIFILLVFWLIQCGTGYTFYTNASASNTTISSVEKNQSLPEQPVPQLNNASTDNTLDLPSKLCENIQKQPLNIIASPNNNKDEILTVMIYSPYIYGDCTRQQYTITLFDENGKALYNSTGYSYDLQTKSNTHNIYLSNVGTFNIQVKSNDTNEITTTQIRVIDILDGRTFQILLYGTAGSFILLMLTILLVNKKIKGYTILSPEKAEILRFIFISILAASLVFSLVFTNTPLFPSSPVGLILYGSDNQKSNPVGNPYPTSVTNYNNNNNNKNPQFTQIWMINIGGAASNGYEDGVLIPLSIVLFGIGGGYLRFLYENVSRYKKGLEGNPEKVYDANSAFYGSMYDIGILFLSPILAIATYLILTYLGIDEINILIGVSLTIGLVTEETVLALLTFVKKILSGIGETSVKNSTIVNMEKT